MSVTDVYPDGGGGITIIPPDWFIKRLKANVERLKKQVKLRVVRAKRLAGT